MNLEFNWLAEHPKKKAAYRGRYIAVVGDAIVAFGEDLADVLTRARVYEKGGRKILISRVALKEILTT